MTERPMTDEQLAPCPMCGDKAQRFDILESGSVIRCVRCETMTRIFPRMTADAELYAAWNRRAPSPAASASYNDGLRSAAKICAELRDMWIRERFSAAADTADICEDRILELLDDNA